MMKKIITLTILAALLYACGGKTSKTNGAKEETKKKKKKVEKVKTDAEKKDLKGKVKSVEDDLFYLKVKDGKTTKEKMYRPKKYTFHENGTLIQEEEFDKKQALRNKVTFKLNEANKIAEEKIFYSPKGELILEQTYFYKYDKLNRLIEIKRKRNKPNSKEVVFSTYKYNAANQLSESNERDRYKNLWTQKVFEYDAQGKLVKRSHYLRDSPNDPNPLLTYFIFKYDAQYNLIEEQEISATKVKGTIKSTDSSTTTYKYDSNNNLIEKKWGDSRRDTYKYNAQNQKTEEVHYNKDGKLEKKQVYTYDSKGNITEHIITSADGKLEKKQVYTYDNKGNKIKHVITSADGKPDINQYEYDAQNNWIKHTYTVQGSSDSTIYTRKIEYH